ncbi:extracellular solute-binding protein [Seminavis robusta]|uniref:Extracellular solute-binding protein n=1 Tax=Seminavis robusta TaxID=568900 RepID=A0A9N8H851_9STRA|nr:extracellular solute-binding protein [Seminavis robusta]|eukprot:Sro227_g092290.1 extracellular solute-binding protein (879) ;mRNA; r:40290-43182
MNRETHADSAEDSFVAVDNDDTNRNQRRASVDPDGWKFTHGEAGSDDHSDGWRIADGHEEETVEHQDGNSEDIASTHPDPANGEFWTTLNSSLQAPAAETPEAEPPHSAPPDDGLLTTTNNIVSAAESEPDQLAEKNLGETQQELTITQHSMSTKESKTAKIRSKARSPEIRSPETSVTRSSAKIVNRSKLAKHRRESRDFAQSSQLIQEQTVQIPGAQPGAQTQPGAHHHRIQGIDGDSGAATTRVRQEEEEKESEGGSNYLAQATLVEPDEDPIALVEAQPLTDSIFTSKLFWFAVFGILFLVIATVVVVLYFTLGTRESGSKEVPTGPIEPGFFLDRINKAGVLRCGVDPLLGTIRDFFGPESGGLELIDLALCRAIAAAVFGDDSRADFVTLPARALDPGVDFAQLILTDGFDALYSNASTVDVLFGFWDLFNMDILGKLSVGTPYLYYDNVYAGIAKFVDCAERNDLSGDCSDLKVCMVETFAPRQSNDTLFVNDGSELLLNFINGECNVAIVFDNDLAKTFLGLFGYDGEFVRGETAVNEYYAITTHDGDPQWSDFVNSIPHALLAAEEAGITQQTAEAFGATDLFGEQYKDMFINAIAAVGNYGEMYEREYEPIFPRPVINYINDGSTGLHQSYLIGVTTMGPEPLAASAISVIKERGELRCAVKGNRTGFASYNNVKGEWQGIDIDYCRALQAAVFLPSEGSYTVIEINDESEGYSMLANGTADVFAGATWTIRSDIKEATTGLGYSFSQPYFYGPVNAGNGMVLPENLCLATRQEDQEWVSFVLWTVTSLFYAEHNGVDSSSAELMPSVSSFGCCLYNDMFVRAVAAVGNYGDIYERNLHEMVPRGGRNLLFPFINATTPKLYVPPGFF